MGPKLLRCIPISYVRNAPGTQAMNICTCENAAAWCRKMGLRLDTGLALQQVLEGEPVRLRLRDDLKLADAAKEHLWFGEYGCNGLVPPVIVVRMPRLIQALLMFVFSLVFLST